MGSLIGWFKTIGTHVGINLCRGNILVSQHLLNSSQVGTIVQQVRSERMSYSVRSNRLSNPRNDRIFLKKFPKSLPGQHFAPMIKKQHATVLASH